MYRARWFEMLILAAGLFIATVVLGVLAWGWK